MLLKCCDIGGSFFCVTGLSEQDRSSQEGVLG